MRNYLLIIFMCLCAFSFSQTPQEYYQDYYKSMKYFSLGRIDSAMKCIKRFEKSSSFDVNGARLKLKILNETSSKNINNEFLKLVEKTGIELDYFEYIVSNKKAETELILTDELKEKYETSHLKYLNQLTNLSFSDEIKKILDKDQHIRRLEMKVDFNDTVNMKLMEEELNIVDKENFESIKLLIKTNGLPTEEKMGSNQYYLVLMAGMHLSVSSELPEADNYFDSVFLGTLKIGQLSPEYYMYYKDAVSRKTNNCQIYGYLQFNHPVMKIRSLYTFCKPTTSTINKERSKIGAGKIQDQCRFERVYCNYKVSGR